MIAAVLLLVAQAATPSPAPIVPPADANPANPAAAAPSPAAAPAPAAPAAAAADDAAQIYARRCTFCHGDDGKGQTDKGKKLKAPNFAGDRWQKHTTDKEIVDAITDGIPKHKMPSFKEKLSAAEIEAMVPYLRAFAANK